MKNSYKSMMKLRYTFVLGDYVNYIERGTGIKNNDLIDYMSSRSGSLGTFSFSNISENEVKKQIKYIKKISSENLKEFLKIVDDKEFENLNNEQKQQVEKVIKNKLTGNASDKKTYVSTSLLPLEIEKKLHNKILNKSNELKKKGRFFLIPIVSFKEKDAKKLMIDNKEEMKEIAETCACLTAEAYNCKKSNLIFLGAYHEKPEIEGLSTRQPHFHTIIFDKSFSNKNPKLIPQKLNELHQDLEQYCVNKNRDKINEKYVERKNIKTNLTNQFQKTIEEKHADKLFDIQLRLSKITHFKGKKSFQFLYNDVKKMNDILRKSEENPNFSLSDEDAILLKKYDINNDKIENIQVGLENKILELSSLLVDVDNLTKEIIHSEECKDMFSNWKEVTSVLATQNGLTTQSTLSDEMRFKEVLNNKILRFDEEKLLNNAHVSNDAKEEFLDAMQYGKFSNFKSDKAILKVVEDMATTAKVVDMPKKAFEQQMFFLLRQSKNDYEKSEISSLIDEKYNDKNKKFITKEEFKNNLKMLNYNTKTPKVWVPDEKYRGKFYKEKFLKLDHEDCNTDIKTFINTINYIKKQNEKQNVEFKEKYMMIKEVGNAI